MATCRTEQGGLTPGRGFVHKLAWVARGERYDAASTCCNLCEARDGCEAWMHRRSKCYLGTCAAEMPCFERLRTAQQPLQVTVGAVAKSRRGQAITVRLCGHPTVPNTSQSPAPLSVEGRRGTIAAAASRVIIPAAHGLALLMLGHRSRLMFETVPPNVIAPTVAAGTSVDVFAYLENSTMAPAFRGFERLGDPVFAALSDAVLAERIASAVEAAGGRSAVLRIGPQPTIVLHTIFPQRLSGYIEQTKMTVVKRFAKDLLGLRLVEGYERERGRRYAWVLWIREDSHWFAPLELARFQRGVVHGKACGGFGGWNDKVWLMDRGWAPAMLSMHDTFYTAYPASCTDLARRSSDADSAASDSDFLAAWNVEQFRERVGKLHQIPFLKHTPEDLPTMDSHYRKVDKTGEWMLCFPRIYSNGCVPRVNASAVARIAESWSCRRQTAQN